MSCDRHFDQAAEIVRGLAALPGGKALNIVGTKFSRLLPGEPGTGYERREELFDPHEVNRAEPPIPHGMDDFELTLKGELGDAHDADALMVSLREMLSDDAVRSEWDYRSRIEQFGGLPTYTLTVFTDTVPTATSLSSDLAQ